MEDFKIGDVVKLKSGGPAITISAMDEEKETLHLVWFDYTADIPKYCSLKKLTVVFQDN